MRNPKRHMKFLWLPPFGKVVFAREMIGLGGNLEVFRPGGYDRSLRMRMRMNPAGIAG